MDGLTKAYSRVGPPAISRISFSVPDGQVVGFVGLNGAGKTTTIRIAAGLVLPTSGRVTVDGNDIVDRKVDASRSIGWVPELPNFDPGARAESLMRYFAGFYGLQGDEARQTIVGLMERVGLRGSEQKRIREYSQGMRKRFALAASMIGNPQNYLFDEVLNGLDPEGVRFVRRLMFDLRKSGRAVLLSSHILTEVEGVADSVVIIHRGTMIRTLDRNYLQELASQDKTLEDYFMDLVQERKE